MFKIAYDYFLEVYRFKSYIIKKKSEYFLIVIFITFVSMFMMLLLDLFAARNRVDLLGDAVYLLACVFAIFFLKKYKLEMAINIYIGGYICVMFIEEIVVNLITNDNLSQYRVLIFITTLVVGFVLISLVAIKKYQVRIILYFSIFVTLLDFIIVYVKDNGNNFNGDMITNFIYYFIIVLGGCVICLKQFKMNDEAIRIVDNQNKQLFSFAYCDDLTGLFNRKKLLKTIELLITDKNEKFAILFIGLDNFKNINDNFGHQSGDEVLKIVSKRLKGLIISNNILSRIGGDEFAIILRDFRSLEDLEKFVDDVRKVLAPTILYEGKELYIGASIGVSIFPQHGEDVDTLMNNADLAMFEVKQNGGYGYQIYSSEIKNRHIDKLKMKMKLNNAMVNKEFITYYQPILDLKSMQVIGSESLIRWKHGDKMIPPMEFIPIAKKIGELVAIDNWMMKSACTQCAKWNNSGSKAFYISVNTSYKQLTSANFLELVKDLLKNSTLTSMQLYFEITEDEAMENPDVVISILNELKAIGVKISLDDFGTGYSSLSYVNRLPIDIIKIDISLIKNLKKGSKNILIVKSIIDMAHNLNIKVVAEGIETEEELNILNELKCDFIQGYLIGKPMLAEDFEEKFVNID